MIRSLIVDDNSSDRNFFDSGIVLNYQINGGAVQQVPMMFSGATVYRGVIPEQTPGTMIDYFVTAADMRGNSADGDVVSVTVGGILLGDINCDGAVNLLDVQPFVELLSSGEFNAKGDFDGDGVNTLLDVSGFIAALGG